MKNNITEIIVTTCLIFLTILLLNPFHFWMPSMMVICMIAIIFVLFGIYASFVLREKSEDERAAVHQALAGRNAFLAGSLVLMVGILIQGYSHAVDPWLVLGLVIMIIVKIITRIWSDSNM